MAERREDDRKQQLDYLYRRLKLLDDAIRSLEALAKISPDINDLSSLPKPDESDEEPA